MGWTEKEQLSLAFTSWAPRYATVLCTVEMELILNV